jgi:hypothetical protein
LLSMDRWIIESSRCNLTRGNNASLIRRLHVNVTLIGYIDH